MLDQLQILAEGGAHASEGVSPFLVGGGMFLILLCLLGITYLFSGLNQDTDRGRGDVVRTHGPSGSHGASGAHGTSGSHGGADSGSHRSH